MARHVVLVGLPGSGKSTVGRLVAAALGAPFVDLDDVVELSSGKSIAQLFTQRGEPEFRLLERQAMERALEGAASVIAAGGGWLAQPGNLEGVRGRAVIVYLQATPEVAARRVSPTDTRPLLRSGDVTVRLRELLAERQGYYQRSDASVSADRDPPDAVAAEVVKLARSLAGWY